MIIMLQLLAIFLLQGSSVLAATNTAEYGLNVLPLPTKYDIGSEVICLSSDFQISVDPAASQDLHDAIGRTLEHLQDCKHEYLSIWHGSEFFQDSSECKHWLSSLVLSFDSNTHSSSSILDGAIQQPEDRMEWEAYHLTVPTNGTATLTSASALGLFRGLTTFEALFFYLPEQSDYSSQMMSKRWNWQGGWLYAPFGPYEIWDKPAFGWRSVLVDTSRQFFSIKSLKSVRLFFSVLGASQVDA
jgi:hexosaminidase